MNWKVGDRCKLVKPRLMSNYGLTGTITALLDPSGELVPAMDEMGLHCLDWADCAVMWDDGDEAWAELWRLVPLTPPKPDLADWEDMPCEPSGKYKEEVYA